MPKRGSKRSFAEIDDDTLAKKRQDLKNGNMEEVIKRWTNFFMNTSKLDGLNELKKITSTGLIQKNCLMKYSANSGLK